MNIIFLGPQGSGKGTQAKLVASKFNLFYFESGEFLREIAKENEELRRIMDEGKLVADREMVSYVEAFFDSKAIYDDVIFDGFPRDLKQYGFLKEWLDEKKMKIDYVFVLEISEKTTNERLLLRKREDDTSEAIKERLRLYKLETEPLIGELEKEIKVIKINGERTVEEIHQEICKKLV